MRSVVKATTALLRHNQTTPSAHATQRVFGAMSVHGSKSNVRLAHSNSNVTRRDGRNVHTGHPAQVSFYDTMIETTAAKPSMRLSLQQIYQYGKDVDDEKLIQAARHVRKELMVRIAQQIHVLQTLPFILMTNPHITEVHRVYHESLEGLRKCGEITTIEQDAQFTEMLSNLFQDTMGVVDLMGKGLAEATHRVPRELLNVDSFLDAMLHSRIGRRVLAEQHIALHRPPQDNWVGIICSKTKPFSCLNHASALAQALCQETYGIAPRVEYQGDTDVNFTYIPFHLEYICVELLKNAMRATVEKHGKKRVAASELPPITVLIAEGSEHVTICFSDQGGGIPPFIQEDIFRYGFTTAKPLHDLDLDEEANANPMSDFNTSKSSDRLLAGRGFGLPMSKLYAGFYGGDMQLVSIDGYGTNVYLRINKTGTVPEDTMHP